MKITNQKSTQRALSLVALIVLSIGTVLPVSAQTRRTSRRPPRLRRYSRPVVAPVQPNYYTVGAGQTVRVRLNEQISSETARIGGRFTTTVVDPVYVNGVEVIPAGSIIGGRVTEVERAGRQSKAGSVGVSFVSLQLPNNSTRAINGALTDLSSDKVNSDREGQVSGRSSAKRNVVFIGGGAATGATIGAIAGGGKGAGIGAGVGAGIGAAGAIFSKGEEAKVQSGTEFGVVLNQAVSLPAWNAR
ncbi:MAG: hypothetical protein ABR577_05485 [Pyrinomonadaceae bacterium]